MFVPNVRYLKRLCDQIINIYIFLCFLTSNVTINNFSLIITLSTYNRIFAHLRTSTHHLPYPIINAIRYNTNITSSQCLFVCNSPNSLYCSMYQKQRIEKEIRTPINHIFTPSFPVPLLLLLLSGRLFCRYHKM